MRGRRQGLGLLGGSQARGFICIVLRKVGKEAGSVCRRVESLGIFLGSSGERRVCVGRTNDKMESGVGERACGWGGGVPHDRLHCEWNR